MVTQKESEIEWDPLAVHPDVLADYEALRSQCPVAHSEAFGGYWMLNSYEDVIAAATDPLTFASAPSIFVENTTVNSFRSIPITLDRPEHTLYRRVLDRYFLSRRVVAFEPRVRGLALDELTPFLAEGGGDFVGAVAYSFPVRVLCAILGLDDSMWPTVKQITPVSNRELTAEQIERFRNFILDVVEERRTAPRNPEEDLLSGVIAATIDGAPIEPANVVRIVHQLFTAGHSTTTHALGNAVGYVASDQDMQSQLRKDPKLIPGAIEEFLRLQTPLHQIARRLTRDVVVGEVAMESGDQVVLNFASANRDGREFASPEDLDITRSPNRHAAFGAGIHKCLGAPVARMEIRVVLEELLARTSSIEVVGSPVPFEYVPGGHFFSGYESLPIRLIAV